MGTPIQKGKGMGGECWIAYAIRCAFPTRAATSSRCAFR
jgi:hypothetical protein